ncbi:expressed unknown protein [Seminavis robusta]|uniref:Uncharacterized protein n=1 Tax=Seminavis robusta TaxID=568900 RepID=A0A9N8EQL4_9STRA|nr:expressed unknown protein [Seminavis robusta]|eukprot:Sro1613_g286070.1 n/a (659) ;mRNA; r:23052-25028
MGTKLKKSNAANMGPKERIVKITRRLEQDQLGPKMKAKLLARLVMLQGLADGFAKEGKQPAFPGLAMRLAIIQEKLKTEEDPARRAELEKRKANVQNRLAQKQQMRANKQCQNIKQRLSNIEAKLMKEKDPAARANLEARKANLEAKLANKENKQDTSRGVVSSADDHEQWMKVDVPKPNTSFSSAEAGASAPKVTNNAGEDQKEEDVGKLEVDEELIAAFPQVTKRLTKITLKLKTVKNPDRRKALLNRKAKVEAKLARKQESLRKEAKQEDTQVGLDGVKEEEEDFSGPEVDPQLIVAFPKVTQRLIKIALKLKTVTNEGQRQYLLQRKAKVEANLARKQQQLKNRAMKRGSFPGINRKLAMIDTQLKLVNDDTERADLEKRKVLLLRKRMEKRQAMDAGPGGHISCQLERTQALLVEATTPERQCSLESRLLHFQQRQEEASPSTLSCAPYDPRREKQKQKFIQMEQKARSNKNEKALDRIALQQVYVAHYPDPQHYVSAFGGNKSIKKRAILRAQALDLASSEQGVNWIAADMYERLPQQWSMDDEVATFGDKQQQNQKNVKKSAANNESEEDFVAVCAEEDVLSLDDFSEKFLPDYGLRESGVLEDGFEKVPLLDAKAIEDEGWMEVDAKETDLPAVAKKANKNGKETSEKHG